MTDHTRRVGQRAERRSLSGSRRAGGSDRSCRPDRSEARFSNLNQYKNQANPDAHYRTTGPEIWRQTEGKITHFVAGLGTCGTITGTGRFLKEQAAGTKVLGVHPAERHDIPGVRSMRQLKQTELLEELSEVAATDARLPKDRSAPILTVCNVGEKSLYAMLLLKAHGYEKVKNMMGGMTAWMAEGMPTESGS